MMATGDTRTSLPITMVPVRSLITTFAGPVGLNRQRFELGDELGGARGKVRRNRDAHQAGVVGVSDGLSIRREVMIDDFGDAGRGGEVGFVELEAHLLGRLNGGRWALDDGAVPACGPRSDD